MGSTDALSIISSLFVKPLAETKSEDMTLGKKVGDDLYVHINHIIALELGERASIVERAIDSIKPTWEHVPNIVKINLRSERLSLLAYAEFDNDPFPELVASWSFAPGSVDSPSYRTYLNSLNPPILHRKELLVPLDYPGRLEWTKRTQVAEQLGLFDASNAIGFRLNWNRLIESKGYRLINGEFLPLGNDEGSNESDDSELFGGAVKRHLTALTRTNLSAPVQMLLRHALVSPGKTFFDYGCGRGSDVEALSAYGVTSCGWDPHFASDQPIIPSDVVNLGFVVNVIEDPAERVEAIQKAFSLAKGVMSIGVMLYGRETPGKPFRDGFMTSRNTFQKYFSQGEFKDFIEHVLGEDVFLVGPGVAFVFADKELQQRFCVDRYRSSNISQRLLSVSRPRVVRTPAERIARVQIERTSKRDAKFESLKPILDALWTVCLELGRYPEADEVLNLAAIHSEIGSFGLALRHISERYDLGLLKSAQETRKDDLRLFLAMQQFDKRPPLRSLDLRLQRDIKAFFGDYRAAQDSGLKLLTEAANSVLIREACEAAAGQGLGHLQVQQSLLIHISLVERLPVALRAYVGCGLVLYNAVSEVQLIKIHIDSGKLTLMQYDDFELSAVPVLAKRIKVNIRKQDYDVFEYGTQQYPKQMLAWKSRFINEDTPGFPEQLLFDEQLESLGVIPDPEHGHFPEETLRNLERMRFQIDGLTLVRSLSIPDLDQMCGDNLTFRQLIECGETQQRLGLANIPKQAATYNALFDLAVNMLDPIIEYFGSIQLTYAFSSPELSKHISARIAPKLDQHAAAEVDKKGNIVCDRQGAACDLYVEDENMREVADWVIANLPFDRLYFYGDDRPIHLSFGPENSKSACEMIENANGRRIPSRYKSPLT